MTRRPSPIYVRPTSERLKQRLEAFARHRGISANTAALVLLTEGLDRADKEAGATHSPCGAGSPVPTQEGSA